MDMGVEGGVETLILTVSFQESSTHLHTYLGKMLLTLTDISGYLWPGSLLVVPPPLQFNIKL